MKKVLIKELNDIRRIMGLPLLVEQGIVGTTTEFLTPIFRKLLNKGDDYVLDLSDTIDFFDRKVAELGLPENTVDDIIDTFSDVNAYNALDITRKRNVFKVISEIDELSEPLGNKLLEKLLSLESINSLDDINKSILTRMLRNPKLKYDEALKQVFDGTGFSGMEPLFEKLFKGSFFKYESKFNRITAISRILQEFKYTRNLGRMIQVASEYKRGIENLTAEIVSLFGQDLISIENPKNLLRLKREVENKLLAIETITDDAAAGAMTDIEKFFENLKKSGGISQGEYEKIQKFINRVKGGAEGRNTEYNSNAVFEEFIAPISNDLDNEVNGWSAFFNQMLKSSPVIFKKIDGSKKYFIVGTYRPRFNIKDSFTRLVNLGVFGSPQTGADLLKRFISNNGKVGKTVLQTYFRTVLVQTILPGIAFMFNYVTYALKDRFYPIYVDLQDKGYLSESWDWRPEFYEGIELWKKLTEDRIKLSFSDAFNDDILTWTYSDLIPAYNTYVDEVVAEIWSLMDPTDVSPEDVENRVRNRETPTPTPTPTPDNNTPNTGEVTAEQLQQLEDGVGPVESIGNGRYKDVDGYLYKFEDNKWKLSSDEGQTWIDLFN